MGRAGAGPGEFTFLTGLWMRSPDTLVAYDADSLRLSRFSMSGAFLDDVTFRGEAGLYLGTFSGGDHAVAGNLQGERDRSMVTPDIMQVARYTPRRRAGCGVDYRPRDAPSRARSFAEAEPIPAFVFDQSLPDEFGD